MKKTLLIIVLVISSYGFGQEILMQNGTFTSCSGLFYDSGGEFSNYSNDESLLITICPEESEQRIQLDFQSFSTQVSTDVMSIYDGSDTSGSFVGSFSGPLSLGLITAGLDNTSGCLTIEFISDNSGNTQGWAAAISCTTPCQGITAQLDSTFPALNSEGIIEVCTGENINLSGSGIFEDDGTGASYLWDLGNGNVISGQNVDISYDSPGVYFVAFNIRDSNTDNIMQGCPSTNSVNLVVRVSGEPNFTGTVAADSTLCFGESTTIEGSVSPAVLIYNCPPPESEETFLPDGNGSAYSTCINVACFDANLVLTDVSQIFDICLNLEHSFSGDLDIFITAPNGQQVQLFSQAGGGTFFGIANDDETINPGVGADYCFSTGASTLLQDANTIQVGPVPQRASWEPGTYLPFESFDALLGSPLNGDWCIEVIDNLAADNGYMFSWELNFDSSVPQENFEFIPSITSQSWDSDPSIIEVNGNIITVAPNAEGEFCYSFRTVDEFGCEYVEEVCVSVAPEGATPLTYYEDLDGDGFGDENSVIVECSGIAPVGYVLNGLDCNDDNGAVNPDASDALGNNVDENCDGVDGNALGIDDFSFNRIKIVSNPFKEDIVLDVPTVFVGTTFNVSVYDINGRIVFEDIFVNSGSQFQIIVLEKLESGPYFLKIAQDKLGLSMVKKLLKI